MAEEEKKVRESNGEECNMLLKNTIEGIIIKWAHQIDEVGGKSILRKSMACIFVNSNIPLQMENNPSHQILSFQRF